MRALPWTEREAQAAAIAAGERQAPGSAPAIGLKVPAQRRANPLILTLTLALTLTLTLTLTPNPNPSPNPHQACQ